MPGPGGEAARESAPPRSNVAQAPVIPKPRPSDERPPTEIPWRAKGPQGTRLPFSEDKWVRWKWPSMTEAEKGAITAISDLAGQPKMPRSGVLHRPGVWTPEDLLYFNGLESTTLMLGQHKGYEPSVVVFYCLLVHGYTLYPFEPCEATPPQGGARSRPLPRDQGSSRSSGGGTGIFGRG